MEKIKSFILSLIINTIYFFNAYSADQVLEPSFFSFEHISTQTQQTDRSDWTRVKAQFNREQFLKDYNREHGGILEPTSLDPDKLNEICWKNLFTLKDHYKMLGDSLNYAFTYLSMAKLFLTYKRYPPDYEKKADLSKKKFHQDLRDTIGQNVIPRCLKHGKLLKWTYIYEGMLFLDYVKQFPNTHRRQRYLADAYHEFTKAIELGTTKTAYLLAAEVILDFGFSPDNISRNNAEALAQEYLEKAFEKNSRISSTSSNNLPQDITIVEAHARPTYISEVDKAIGNSPIHQNSTSPSPNSSHHDMEEDQETAENSPETPVLPPDYLSLERDPLENFDYRNMVIPQRQNDSNLSIRTQSHNKIGMPQELYTIDDKKFQRQNVSGNGMRCFFNAVGLLPDEQIDLLNSQSNNPILRYMIANEIVSAVHNPEQIPPQVKEAINYDLYQIQRGTLNQLDEKRGRLLVAQNANANTQNPQSLPQVYQQLGRLDEEYLEQLRQRALTLQAYKAFINYHISNEQMMVTLHELQENGNANFTSIDAICCANAIGIRIYQPQGNGLRLAHQYIPSNAKEIVYIYHNQMHFQALIPLHTDEPDNAMDIDQASNQDVDLDPGILKNIPSNDELNNLYPTVQTYIKRHIYEASLVRKVLYMHQFLNINNKIIGSAFNLDPRRISEIFLENQIRQKNYFSNELLQDLAHSYLEFYGDIQSGKITQAALARAFSTKNNLPHKSSVWQLSTAFKEGQKDETSEHVKKQSPTVINMYKKRKSFNEIKEETKLSVETIVKIIYENISPQDYINPTNLALKRKTLTEDEKRELVIKAFNDLKTSQSSPPVLSVQRTLEPHGIGYKTVERILKEEKLIQTQLKAKHLSEKQKDAIKKDFAAINPEKGMVQETYEKLAKKHGASCIQIIALLKHRTYDSKGKQKIQKNYDLVVAAYHKLTPEEKKQPAPHIAQVVKLKNRAINDILEKAGLYKWDGKQGRDAGNLLANAQPTRKKRPYEELEQSTSVEESESSDKEPPAKRQKKN